MMSASEAEEAADYMSVVMNFGDKKNDAEEKTRERERDKVATEELMEAKKKLVDILTRYLFIMKSEEGTRSYFPIVDPSFIIS